MGMDEKSKRDYERQIDTEKIDGTWHQKQAARKRRHQLNMEAQTAKKEEDEEERGRREKEERWGKIKNLIIRSEY
jgi:hypothetical protein